MRWIEIDDARRLLPLGEKRGWVLMSEQLDSRWEIEHLAENPLPLRTRLSAGLTFERARQFSERYALAGKLKAELVEPDAAWRNEPMSGKQRLRMILLAGYDPIGLNQGEASDLYQRTKALDLLARSFDPDAPIEPESPAWKTLVAHVDGVSEP